MDEIARVAAAVGIEDMPRRPSVYLGAFECNVLDVTTAYTVLANDGVRKQSYIIERIDDASGETIYRSAHIQARALDPGVNWMVSSILSKVLERGTASAAKSQGFTKPAAGKTGTTNDFKDAWFVGYTTSLTCGVWVGLDHPETIIPHGYGAALALPIWTDVMKSAPPQRYPANELRPSVPLRRVTVCSQTNQLATSGCERAGTAYTIDLPVTRVPKDGCGLHKGGVLAGGESGDEGQRKNSNLPQSIFRSFKKFFGGE
jgi:penicillin-binding protein 1A